MRVLLKVILLVCELRCSGPMTRGGGERKWILQFLLCLFVKSHCSREDWDYPGLIKQSLSDTSLPYLTLSPVLRVYYWVWHGISPSMCSVFLSYYYLPWTTSFLSFTSSSMKCKINKTGAEKRHCTVQEHIFRMTYWNRSLLGHRVLNSVVNWAERQHHSPTWGSCISDTL